MPKLVEIGRVRLLQAQRSSLKLGARPNRWYDPAPLTPAACLRLFASGIVGVTAAGEEIVDVHNAKHPETKNHERFNGISIGFTSHYREMRERYGPHLYDGCAGENIILEADRRMALADLGAALLFEGADGTRIELVKLLVAAPCLEFARYANREAQDGEALKATVQFLNLGTRGFYATLAEGQDGAEVRAGDRVFARMAGTAS
ncbi:MAG: hypothetical protein HY291_11925 [Planctomycetes bacterium]|nr:hypothetical protein [Planctomycetota bacterium]